MDKMSSDIIRNLEELQEHSHKFLDPRVIAVIKSNGSPITIVKYEQINYKWVFVPTYGASKLLKKENTSSRRKTRTLFSESDPLIKTLNHELSGGDSYPVLTTALGIAGGFFSGGGSILFSAAVTGLSLAQKASQVLARHGDEIWHIEEIGKEGDNAVYVSSFLIVDPYRKHSDSKGWLIHEERHDLTLI